MKLRAQRASLLVLPVVLYASYLQLKADGRKTGPRLVLDKIESKSSSSVGYDAEVTMFLRAEGQWPEEVTHLIPSPNANSARWGMSDQCDVFYKKNGQWKPYQWPKGIPSILYPAAIYNQSYGGFIRKYSVNLSAIPANLKPLLCKTRTEFYADTVKSYRGKGSPMKADAAVNSSIQLR